MAEDKNKLQETEDNSNMMDWLFLVLKRWKIVLLIFVIVASAASYKTYNKFRMEKPTYTSIVKLTLGHATLEVKTEEGNVIERKSSDADEHLLLSSSLVARQAAAILREKYGYKDSEDQLVSEIKRSLSVYTPGGRSGNKNVLEISAWSENPQRAYDMVSAVLEGYKKQKEQDEKEFFQKAYETFSDQLDAAHKELLEAENALASYIVNNEKIIRAMETHGMSDQEDQDVISASLNERVLKHQHNVLNLEKFLINIKGLQSTNPLSALTMISKRYSQLVDITLKDMFFEKEEELRRLLTINEEAHPSVIQARGEKDALQGKINNEIAAAIEEIEAELAKMQAQEEELSSLIASGLYEKLIAYNMLKRDIVIKRNIYNNISEALYQIDLGEKVKHYTEFRILEPHKLPYKGIKKFPIRDIAPGILVALACSVGVAYILDRIDTSIKDIEELEKLIDLPVLATIPAYHKRSKQKSKEE